MKRSLLILTLLLAPIAATAQSNDALDAGEILVTSEPVKGSDVPRMNVTAVVDAPPAKVYEVVTNCDRFPERLPRILAAEFVSKSASGARCKVTVDVPFPLSNLTAITQDKRKAGPDVWYRKWTLVEGDYERMDGSFVLQPFRGDENRTLVKYTIHAVPKTAVPDFLREKAQRSSLPDMIERIRKEVRKL